MKMKTSTLIELSGSILILLVGFFLDAVVFSKSYHFFQRFGAFVVLLVGGIEFKYYNVAVTKLTITIYKLLNKHADHINGIKNTLGFSSIENLRKIEVEGRSSNIRQCEQTSFEEAIKMSKVAKFLLAIGTLVWAFGDLLI